MITRGAGINRHTSESLGRSSPVRREHRRHREPCDNRRQLAFLAGLVDWLLWQEAYLPLFLDLRGLFCLDELECQALRGQDKDIGSCIILPFFILCLCHRLFQGDRRAGRLDTQSGAKFGRQGSPHVIHAGAYDLSSCSDCGRPSC